jgi:hypothetical protein
MCLFDKYIIILSTNIIVLKNSTKINIILTKQQNQNIAKINLYKIFRFFAYNINTTDIYLHKI